MNATAATLPSPAKTYGILREGAIATIAYKLTLLDAAYIRTNSPDEIVTRTYNGKDYYVLPCSKVKHGMRAFMERINRDLGISPTCRAQNYCGECPSCLISGTFGNVGENKKEYGLGTKVDFTDAIALVPGTDNVEVRTVNSVDPMTQKTGTSGLTRRLGVPPGTEFYGMVTVANPSEDALKLVTGGLLAITRIGAATAVAGLCTVEIIGIREARVEPASWSPMRVILAGALPVMTELEKKRAPFTTMEDLKQEEAFVEAYGRFYQEMVKPAVAGLLGRVSKVAKDVKTVIEALNGLEAGTTPANVAADAIEKALKGIVKTDIDSTVKDLLNDILTQLGEAQKAGKAQKSNAPTKTALIEAMVDLREAMQTVASV